MEFPRAFIYLFMLGSKAVIVFQSQQKFKTSNIISAFSPSSLLYFIEKYNSSNILRIVW